MMKKNLILSTILVFALTISTAVLAKSPDFETIDYPGAWYTFLRGINNRGQIVGYDSGPDAWGSFLFDGDTFTTIEFPEASTTEVYRGINDRGQIVGTYTDSDWVSHAFLFDRGTYTIIDPPDPWHIHVAFGINNRGQILGHYFGDTGMHSYLVDGDTFTTIAFPGADYTIAYDINDRGQVVGDAWDDSNCHAFLFDGGTFTTLTIPGSTYTSAQGINNRGQIVGSFYDDTGSHGFVFDGDTFITIDFPGALETWAGGINDRGQIVGSYLDSNWETHGFLAEKIRMAPPASAPDSKVTTTWARIKAR